MKVAVIVLALLVVCGGAAIVWQHLRYVHTRRAVVQDHQPLLYDAATFHVVTFVRTAPEADVLEELRKLRAATRGATGVEWVYAGKVAMAGNVSAQIGPVDWKAIVVLQYPSREAYEQMARSEGYRQALARFPESYSQGFQRPVWPNLLLHQALLVRRLKQLVTGEPSSFPFLRKPGIDDDARITEAVGRLLAERELGARAAVVVNLQKQGTPEQQASDRAYVGRMMSAMAEGGYGPMHIGRAVRVEGNHDFDAVAIVYYPGVQFFADMLRSDFFQGIIGGKQLGDTQATITVPILDRL